MAATIKDTVNTLLDKLSLSSKDDGVPITEPTSQELDDLREKFTKAGQDHVFVSYESLSTPEKRTLYEQLSKIDPEYVNISTDKALKSGNNSSKEDVQLDPLPDSATASILDSNSKDIDSWYSLGLDLVAKGQVAVILMAGGQGTRLGSSAPKGCFDIGLPSQKSLFQIQAERIWKVQQLAEKQSGKKDLTIPWYVMTSGPTREPTEQFFEQHKYFGLRKDDVVIFEQGILPCVTNDGNIILESKAKVQSEALICNLNHDLQLYIGGRCSRWQWRRISSFVNFKCAN